ncbi:hypothetical protein OWR28_11635 [Chryseobacterium sp. 1B4]
MNRTALFFLPCMVISSLVSAQALSVTASGRITDKNKTALPYAHIILKKKKTAHLLPELLLMKTEDFLLTV